MKLQSILFDVDGTLIDSNDLHARCWIEAFANHGKEIDYATIRSQIGKGGDLLVPDLCNAREMRQFGDAVKKERSALFKKKYLPQVRPFPDVRRVFEALHDRGVKLALASSSNQDEVDAYTKLLGVGDLIAAKTSKSDARMSKPSPDIFLAALDRAGCDPEFTFVVGDTPYDILAAHRVALPVVAVRSGGFAEELLAKAEFIMDDVRELVRELDRVDEWFAEE